MPFSIDDRWRIIHLLEADDLNHQLVNSLLDIVEQKSEVLVQRVLKLCDRFDEAKDQEFEAATGITQVDVIKWKENRSCAIGGYIAKIRKDLARAIGYPIADNYKPWADEGIFTTNNINGAWYRGKPNC